MTQENRPQQTFVEWVLNLLEPVRTEIKSTPWPAAAVPVQLSLFG